MNTADQPMMQVKKVNIQLIEATELDLNRDENRAHYK